jgi:uncharacterized integral membrane protein
MAGRRSKLSRLLAWIVGLPVLAACVLFALDNRGTLVLGFWPAPWKLTGPVYLVVLAALVIGFLFGGIIAWLGGHRHRAALGRARAEAERLQVELAELRRRLDAAEKAQRAPAVASAASGEQARRQLIAADS